jgi:hypothetical protein
MPSYKIVKVFKFDESHNDTNTLVISNLETKVNGYIQNGWICVGGMSFIEINGIIISAYQTLFKPD